MVYWFESLIADLAKMSSFYSFFYDIGVAVPNLLWLLKWLVCGVIISSDFDRVCCCDMIAKMAWQIFVSGVMIAKMAWQIRATSLPGILDLRTKLAWLAIWG